uniref:Pentatricopeptide repeat-containing protein n=1 Tax=Kalanchoe fedtschenkoi TaxID=63787 RepID=A0A7N0RAL5_KALFE
MKEVVTTSLIKQCKTLNHLAQIHAQITTQTLNLTNPLLLPTLLQSFTSLIPNPPPQTPLRQRLLSYANSLFHQIHGPATFSYNNLTRACTLLSAQSQALRIFTRMRLLGLPPDSHTFPFVLSASARIGSACLVPALHCQAFKFGFLIDLFVVNNLVHAYAAGAEAVWDAWKVFDESPQRDAVSYNAMIDGFVKSGDLVRAREVFDGMPERESVSWGTMLAGYAASDQCAEAIRLFNRMLGEDGVSPDNVALVAVMSACARLGEVEQGKLVHDYIIRTRIQVDVYLCTALVDLYAKCGDIEMSIKIFESCYDRNLFTWNSMLVGLAMHGHCQTCLDYFSRMVESGIRPDGVSFLAVLVACSHSGLVEDARQLFRDMELVFNVPKEHKHYGCMADLLARAGLIEEANEMIDGMQEGGNLFAWGGLLGGCRTHQNITIAEKAAKNVVTLYPEDGGVYAIMVNVYANAERWDEVEGVRRLMRAKRVKRNAGRSVIHMSG